MGKIEEMTQVEKVEHCAGIAAFEAKKRTDEKAKEETIQGLVDQLHSMDEDRDRKCTAAKEQLIENLKITADKYRTATGVMEALGMIRMTMNVDDVMLAEELSYARDTAANMVIVVGDMVDKAESLDWAEMDKLCEGFYDEDFVSRNFNGVELAEQLMRLDLCRNVGPAAEDMVSFLNRIQEELDRVESKLDEMDKDWRTKYQPQDAEDRA